MIFRYMTLRQATEPIIEVSNLTKKYGDFTAVNDISFSVMPGEIFAFLGPNGAGKSTTIKMLTTLITPTSGSVRIAEHNVITEKNNARSAFGIVFQDPSLDDELTAYENMELHAVLYHVPKKGREERINTLMQLVELNERRNSIVKTFSGGMKRRLEIARGLLHHPKVLFLDEPTVGLDTQTRNLLWEYVEKLNKDENTTIFLTTHYLEEAEMVASRIAIIDHGKIITTGTTQQLIKQTKTTNLEEAYLSLTGKSLRDEEVGAGEAFRMRARARRNR